MTKSCRPREGAFLLPQAGAQALLTQGQAQHASCRVVTASAL